MATYYTHWTTGNDNESAISGATFTESTKNLNKVGAFAAYEANMRIHINAGTNVVDGIYKVVTVTDDDNVVLESTITSDASDPTDVGVEASDGLSESAAFATLNHSADTVAAGDKVWAKHDGTSSDDYLETVTVDTVGTLTNWIVFEGYKTSIGDGFKATIDGESSRSNGITASIGNLFHRFENIIIENCTGDGFAFSAGDLLTFVNCEMNNNGARGMDCDNRIVCVNCNAAGNTTDGFGADQNVDMLGCTSDANGSEGFQCDIGGIHLNNCTMSSNSTAGLTGQGSSAGGALTMINCTVDGDSKDTTNGFQGGNTGFPIILINDIFYDCGTGINAVATLQAATQIGLNNLVNSNTADYNNWNPTGTDVTGAPAFVDEGSQDYRLAAGSAARNAGADNSGSSSPGQDIGSNQSADAGGGILVHPGTSGGARG